MKYLIGYSLFIISWTIISCSSEDRSTVDTNRSNDEVIVNKKQFEEQGMKLIQLSKRPIRKTISSRGYIDVPPTHYATISPFYGGFVKEVRVLPGQKVKRGEVLFTLENPQYYELQREYIEISERLDYLEDDFKRQETLSSENIASEKIYKKAESDYKAALAKHQQLEGQLNMMNVPISKLRSGIMVNQLRFYAPFDGYITEVSINTGGYIDASEIAVSMVNTDHIHLELLVFEKDAINVKEGQAIRFMLPENGEEYFAGSVYLVGKSINLEKRTVEIHGHIEEDGNFIPGMYVEAEIEVSQDSIPCLPEDAFTFIGNKKSVTYLIREDSEAYYLRTMNLSTQEAESGWISISDPQELVDKKFLIGG